MRILQIELTHAEAADPAVIRSIQTLVAMQQAEGSATQILPSAPGNAAPPAAGVELESTAPVVDLAAQHQKAAAMFGGAPGAPAQMTPPADFVAPGMTPPAPQTGLGAARRDVDAAGWPWDARIHAEPPTKTDKGLWRASRKAGASAGRPQVEHELRSLGYGVVNPPPAPAPIAQPQLTPEQQAALLHAQVQGQGTPPAPSPTPMPQPPAPAPGNQRQFPALMMRVQAGIMSKILNHDWLKLTYTNMGIASLMTLMQAHDQIEAIHQMLDQYEIPQHTGVAS